MSRTIRAPLGALIFSIIFAISSGQEVVRVIPTPGDLSRGLAFDGEFLWIVDAGVDSVFRIDPFTGEAVFSFYFETFDPFGGLTMSEDGNLWISNGPSIFLLDVEDGTVLHNFGCPGG
jgi:outer membrane protein assembly factor BamB